MKICFLDDVNLSYTSKDIYSNKIRGAENILINLSTEFSKLNHKVTVYNYCKNNIKIDNINWINLNSIKDKPHYDLAITNNNIKLFDKINASKKVAISHSIQSIEKFIRKGQFFAFFKHKPKIVLLSKYHKNSRNFFLRMHGSFTINWGVDEIFLESILDKNVINEQAIFTSYSDRNLNLLIKIWKDHIYTRDKNKKLLITPINKNYTKFNIFNREFGNKARLVSDVLSSRLFLIPGHKAELYCIAAEEARELCVPMITLGIGCLTERINHGKTGLIARNETEFADYTIQLFNDDIMWNDMRKNLLSLRGSKKWKNIAEQFLKNAYD
tara:strand:- start:94 stop:1074 length:981 start_codon:yes stop_codon:yes gene_type:complete